MINELQTQGTTIEVDPPPRPSGMGTMILFSILPVLILIGALVWLSKKGGASASAGFGDSPARLINPEDNRTTLKDVAGDFDEVNELIDFLHHPEKFWFGLQMQNFHMAFCSTVHQVVAKLYSRKL
jgi:cell division protease FtsH